MLRLCFFAKYRKISGKVKLTVYGFFSIYLGADGIESPTWPVTLGCSPALKAAGAIQGYFHA